MKEQEDDNQRIRWARNDKRCGSCGVLVIHARSTYTMDGHYWDCDSANRIKFFCSRRCLDKARVEDQQGPLF